MRREPDLTNKKKKNQQKTLLLKPRVILRSQIFVFADRLAELAFGALSVRRRKSRQVETSSRDSPRARTVGGFAAVRPTVNLSHLFDASYEKKR